MIYIASALIILICIIYFSRIQLSKGVLLLLYMVLTGNLFYELLNKSITKSTDYLSYLIGFEEVMHASFGHVLDVHIFEPVFTVILWILLHTVPDLTFTVFVLATNVLITIGLYRFFEDKHLSLFALAIYTYFPMFLVMSTNIIRQTFVFGLLLIMFNFKGIKRLCIFIFPLLHSSSFLIVLILLINKHIKVKYAVLGYLFACVLFVTDINRKLFGTLPMFKRYTSPLYYSLSESSGNRLDFLIFTTAIIVMAFVLYKSHIITAGLMNYMLLTGSLFCLLGFLAFSDRIAMYNWFFLIVLLPYGMQFLKDKILYFRVSQVHGDIRKQQSAE
ncbi:EpsG family protein [Staphylococcus simulans]|uniref:EpsG family protein n=1 Tax=Staphylococcus simulans TaxID=1286 RepID=UPI000D036C4E|nr:EpsG family protein [Staphylococcus simulans]